MTEVLSKLEPGQSQSPTLEASLEGANGHDLSAAHQAKFDSLTPTPLSSCLTSKAETMDMTVKCENHVKLEDTSPSQSPTIVADTTPQNFKMSRSPSPPASAVEGTTSKSSTPPLPINTKGSKKAPLAPVQLIADLPIARDEAVKTFREISDNNYQYKSLGRSREISESMTCDCTYEHGSSSFYMSVKASA